MKLSDEEKSLIIEGLQIKKNLIETGSPVLSASDAAERGEPAKFLDRHQRDLIATLEDLIAKMFGTLGIDHLS